MVLSDPVSCGKVRLLTLEKNEVTEQSGSVLCHRSTLFVSLNHIRRKQKKMGQPKALATVGMTFLQLDGGAFKPAPDFRSIGSAYEFMSQGALLLQSNISNIFY